jgi:Co/Zn/Cd efflux system component
MGKVLQITWLDAATGVVGSLVILKWGFDLTRTTAGELLDAGIGAPQEDRIVAILQSLGDVVVLDLHVWPMGRGRMSCILTIESSNPRTLDEYRARILEEVALSHLTIELRRKED